MGQYDVLDLLKGKRKKTERWFCFDEIKEELIKKGLSDVYVKKKLHDDLFKLVVFDVIEIKGVGLWNHKKYFRAKKSI